MHGKGEIMGRLMKKIKNKQYGQAMAEFALTLPIFLLLVFGIIELSRFFLVYSSVYTASREASRFASSVGEGGTTNYMNCNAIADRAVFHGSFGGVQMEDVTIYYESSPGTIIGSCPNVNSGTTPVQGNCHDGFINCEDEDNPPSPYNPALGDRILVDIETDFSSLLGIVPNMAVQTQNGRTIMKEISVESTPIPYEKCKYHVFFDGEEPVSYPGEDEALYIEVKNLKYDYTGEYQTAFSIYQITNIDWVWDWDEDGDDSNNSKLVKIGWAEEGDAYSDIPIIWKASGEDGETPTIDIPGGDNYWEENTRNLPAGDTKKLVFVFNEAVTQDDLELDFSLIMQHSNLPSDFCWPVVPEP